MADSLIFVDLIETPPIPRELYFANHPGEDAEALADSYRAYLQHYQPWHSLVKSGDNQKPLFKSTERYFNRDDAVHAIELGFAGNSNVYLREAEHGNVALRLANPSAT
jgi:hypothetical protein